MSRYYRTDTTGVPNTCPFLDEIKDSVNSAEFETGSELSNVLSLIEQVREHNATLREIAINALKEKDELEKDFEYKIKELESKIESLEYENSDLKDEVKNLENQIE